MAEDRLWRSPEPVITMSKSKLKLSVGQFSDKGQKAVNQDFYGCCLPAAPQLSLKGAAFAVADGISSSDVSHIASQTAVNNFLEDYYCTSDAWTVKHSAQRVIGSVNGWLHSQSQRSEYRFDKDRGYICTLSSLILKGSTAHLFHVGDSRIYRVRDNTLEQLTKDHRLWISRDQSYLSRAIGMELQLEIDYLTVPLAVGDIFILSTDGVYEYCDTELMLKTIADHKDNLDKAAAKIVDYACLHESPDNLTIQIVRVDQLPEQESSEIRQQIDELPLPPLPEPRANFDGYIIQRALHATSRSHVYLAHDCDTGEQVVLKLPSVDLGCDPAYLERFLMEEWVARRISSAHVMKAGVQTRKRNFLYTVTEYIEGQTLAQWLVDNPDPGLQQVRGIVEQIARGLQAMHRMEILHRDLKPDNIMIDTHGTVKIIDFGAARVAGVIEAGGGADQYELQGTAIYSAPEYFIGEVPDHRSDLYSLAVITYQMLSGRFPYGAEVAKCKTAMAQRRLNYRSVLDDEREIPAWVDFTLKKALQPNPYKRCAELSEFIYELRQPSEAFLSRTRPPLIKRDPVVFWQGISICLSMIIVYLLAH